MSGELNGNRLGGGEKFDAWRVILIAVPAAMQLHGARIAFDVVARVCRNGLLP